MTMRAASLLRGTISVTDVPEPPPLGPNQLLISVQSCGICGSDLSLQKDVQTFVDVSKAGGNLLSEFDPDLPVVPGHEYSGIVANIGSDVRDFAIGDRVTGIGLATDQATGDRTIIGYSNSYPGGFAQRVVVDTLLTRQIPPGVSFDAAALAEPLHVGETHVQQSGVTSDDVALVIGAGPIGLGVVIALVERDCPLILVVEPSLRRRELASKLGAHVVSAPPANGPSSAIPEERGSRRVVVFEASGRQGTLDLLIRTLPHGSAIQVVASPFKPESFIPVIAQWRQIVVNFGGGKVDDAYGVTLNRLATGMIDPDLFITATVGLADVATSFDDLKDPEGHIKIIVHPQE